MNKKKEKKKTNFDAGRAGDAPVESIQRWSFKGNFCRSLNIWKIIKKGWRLTAGMSDRCRKRSTEILLLQGCILGDLHTHAGTQRLLNQSTKQPINQSTNHFKHWLAPKLCVCLTHSPDMVTLYLHHHDKHLSDKPGSERFNAQLPSWPLTSAPSLLPP